MTGGLAAAGRRSADLAVSVVVPTRDRLPGLERCLQALGAQTHGDLDVVVVDDGSEDGAAVERLAAAFGARLARPEGSAPGTAGAGPAAARNAGAGAAHGDVVCFTDDDCAPEPDWVSGLLAALGDGAAAAAGATVAPDAAPPAAHAWQAITEHLQLASLDAHTGRLGFAPSCNLAVRAGVARALPFAESYPQAAGEDQDWCARLLAAGHHLVHAPAARVVHHQDASLRAFWRQQVRYGRGARRFHGDRGSLSPPGFYAGLARRGFAAGPAPGALVLLAQVATAVGYASSGSADD